MELHMCIVFFQFSIELNFLQIYHLALHNVFVWWVKKRLIHLLVQASCQQTTRANFNSTVTAVVQ